jgi:hypothetical protein
MMVGAGRSDLLTNIRGFLLRFLHKRKTKESDDPFCARREHKKLFLWCIEDETNNRWEVNSVAASKKSAAKPAAKKKSGAKKSGAKKK